MQLESLPYYNKEIESRVLDSKRSGKRAFLLKLFMEVSDREKQESLTTQFRIGSPYQYTQVSERFIGNARVRFMPMCHGCLVKDIEPSSDAETVLTLFSADYKDYDIIHLDSALNLGEVVMNRAGQEYLNRKVR